MVHKAIDDKIALLEVERGNLEAEADQLQNLLDKLVEERQWVIAIARAKKITEEDMELQLGAMEFQALDLRKKREEKISTLLVQQKGKYLKEWVEDYLSDVAIGVRTLQSDLSQLSHEERDDLYEGLEAKRYEDKYNGDTKAALQWAIFEEKRRIVRMLVDEVLVVKSEAGKKKIIPIPAIDLPAEFASQVYDHQSPDYRLPGEYEPSMEPALQF